MERGFGEWRWMSVLFECDDSDETEKYKINKKRVAAATKTVLLDPRKTVQNRCCTIPTACTGQNLSLFSQ
jgi:hypothetical protein